MKGGGVCQPGLACANGVAEGRNCFPNIFLPWPAAGVSSLGVVCPETDASHGVERAGFSQTDASAQKVLVHGRVL